MFFLFCNRWSSIHEIWQRSSINQTIDTFICWLLFPKWVCRIFKQIPNYSIWTNVHTQYDWQLYAYFYLFPIHFRWISMSKDDGENIMLSLYFNEQYTENEWQRARDKNILSKNETNFNWMLRFTSKQRLINYSLNVHCCRRRRCRCAATGFVTKKKVFIHEHMC